MGVTILGGAGVLPARNGGSHIFFDVLAAFAANAQNPDVTAIHERFGNPPTVAVLGRPGVGRGAVAAALASSGVRLATDSTDADVLVLVVAEALKPEDRAQLRAATSASGASVPAMVVLNKADLSGVTPRGPLAYAERRASAFATTVGRPVVPMIAHLATVALDEEEVVALRGLATAPADMTSTDSFVGSDHRLPAELRRRLLDRLDRFGLAHAVVAMAAGATGATVARQLRALSQVDGVVERLAAVAAPVRYRKVCSAVHELRTLAAQSGDGQLSTFLTADEVVIAVMDAAVEVVEAVGFAADRPGDADAQLRRAVRWATYARAPVGILHQRCAKDIARGSLRLLGRAL
jgi:hypothetical protein